MSRYQKGKTNLDFTEARDGEWQWHQLGYMQVCTLLQTDNHIHTPPFFTGRMPFLPPNQQRQSTEGKKKVQTTLKINYRETVYRNIENIKQHWLPATDLYVCVNTRTYYDTKLECTATQLDFQRQTNSSKTLKIAGSHAQLAETIRYLNIVSTWSKVTRQTTQRASLLQIGRQSERFLSRVFVVLVFSLCASRSCIRQQLNLSICHTATAKSAPVESTAVEQLIF